MFYFVGVLDAACPSFVTAGSDDISERGSWSIVYNNINNQIATVIVLPRWKRFTPWNKIVDFNA
ncbi:MAG: hypothetical protein PHN40_08890 [Dysgonamonadaceae bacterium]|nr:hypothetical protein [Dysgonamonadaceae bacterium]